MLFYGANLTFSDFLYQIFMKMTAWKDKMEITLVYIPVHENDSMERQDVNDPCVTIVISQCHKQQILHLTK